MAKISIIGAGNLGGFIGLSIAARGIADEIAFVDVAENMAIGQANDVMQAIAYHNNTIVKGSSDYGEIKGSDIIIVTAGKPRTPDIKDRLELGKINAAIVSLVAYKIKEYAPKSIIITLSNPMDVMNYLLWRKTGFERSRVIGSGGQLDSSRFRTVLSKGKVGEVEGYIIGEHGNSQVPVWSRVKIGGEKQNFSSDEKLQIMERIKEAAINVISKKGATVFAPGVGTADMAEAIIKNEKKLMICSAVLDGEYGQNNVSIGVPVVLGRKGIEKIEEWQLAEEEKKAFNYSADVLRKNIKEIIG